MYEKKQNSATAIETKHILGYDPIQNDLRCMFATECFRNSLTQNKQFWYKLQKANPIHRNGIRGKLHPNETLAGKYPLWKFLEKYTFIRKKNSNELMPESDIILIGNGIKHHVTNEIYFVYDILNDQWTENFTKISGETPDDYEDRINDIFENIEFDVENHTNDTMKPKVRLKVIPLIPKYNSINNCNDCQRSLFIQLNNDQQINDIIQTIDLVDDSWDILDIAINQTLFFANANICTLKENYWSLNWIVRLDNTGNCKSYESCLNIDTQSFWLRCVDPTTIIPIGQINDDVKNVTIAYDLSSDGFGAIRHENGSLPFSSVKGFYWSPNHIVCSNNVIFNIGLTQDHSNNDDFILQLEKDILTLIFKGVEVEVDQKIKKIRALPLWAINDQSEYAYCKGSRGPNNERNAPYTSDAKCDDFDTTKPVVHHCKLVTHTVKFEYLHK